ncbi:galactoside O-acetyltransferase [Desulfurobacterium pacificum]|jgi:acetyltransferase-like isoleucine patch superfamily enzyme|uniref:Chloramphenicol acetyltransferase n=1 Tax=Desulfurobacterium pacificum TaxID=240166 RepID=A0ABY1NG04_9BACT|nr:acyltransferase [Desulfurobacterium pacificum]SMP06999.1 galactoside O-acetyltransferase [Desulfurobacterium pacificum]
MAYFSEEELKKMGFKHLGKNVKISTKVSIYYPETIEIGDNSRIDDFCIISGKVKIGRNVHIAPFCLIAGGKEGVILEDFTTLAYSVRIFSRSDDYTGSTLTNVTFPEKYRNVIKKPVVVEKHSIIGTNSIIFPGVVVREGTAVGAMSLVRTSTQPWSIYAGIPAKKIKDRKRDLLELEKKYIEEEDL